MPTEYCLHAVGHVCVFFLTCFSICPRVLLLGLSAHRLLECRDVGRDVPPGDFACQGVHWLVSAEVGLSSECPFVVRDTPVLGLMSRAQALCVLWEGVSSLPGAAGKAPNRCAGRAALAMRPRAGRPRPLGQPRQAGRAVPSHVSPEALRAGGRQGSGVGGRHAPPAPGHPCCCRPQPSWPCRGSPGSQTLRKPPRPHLCLLCRFLSRAAWQGRACPT